MVRRGNGVRYYLVVPQKDIRRDDDNTLANGNLRMFTTATFFY